MRVRMRFTVSSGVSFPVRVMRVARRIGVVPGFGAIRGEAPVPDTGVAAANRRAPVAAEQTAAVPAAIIPRRLMVSVMCVVHCNVCI